jgi:hypothetical protein
VDRNLASALEATQERVFIEKSFGERIACDFVGPIGAGIESIESGFDSSEIALDCTEIC